MNYAAERARPSKYQDAFGLSPAEFDIAVAVLAHEKISSEPPTRLALAEFFGVTTPHAQRLVRSGLLVVSGSPIRFGSTSRLRRLLGVESEARVG